MKVRGFTLIELLVVIAIIGILSAVVLASLNAARTRARDSSVLANMDSLLAQAVVYQDTNSGYGTTVGNDCTAAVFSDPTIQSALASIGAANGYAATACYAADTSFSVAAARPSGTGYTPPTVYWCADSSGKKCGLDDISGISSGSCGCP